MLDDEFYLLMYKLLNFSLASNRVISLKVIHERIDENRTAINAESLSFELMKPAFEVGWQNAREVILNRTDGDSIPNVCPWTLEQVLDTDFFPEILKPKVIVRDD